MTASGPPHCGHGTSVKGAPSPVSSGSGTSTSVSARIACCQAACASRLAASLCELVRTRRATRRPLRLSTEKVVLYPCRTSSIARTSRPKRGAASSATRRSAST